MSETGETVLWHGRPRPCLDWTFRSPLQFAFGLAAFGAPLTPMMVMRSGGSPYWVVFLPVVAIGTWLLFLDVFWQALRRRYTQYYLSDQRLVIDRYWPWGAVRKEWPIEEVRSIKLVSPHIDLTVGRSQDHTRRIRLEHLDDARQVADQVGQAQYRAHAARDDEQ